MVYLPWAYWKLSTVDNATCPKSTCQISDPPVDRDFDACSEEDSAGNQSHIIRLLKAFMYTVGWPFDWGFLILRVKLYIDLMSFQRRGVHFVTNVYSI